MENSALREICLGSIDQVDQDHQTLAKITARQCLPTSDQAWSPCHFFAAPRLLCSDPHHGFLVLLVLVNLRTFSYTEQHRSGDVRSRSTATYLNNSVTNC
ncbi:hypothetical protein VTN31DRAFT_1723 [Thermomyces dupontii]|uniref:uncharacterized protein n=1 Tax=Talaromyces thermophilus TaxID=28565 RepID=UPI0037447AF5